MSLSELAEKAKSSEGLQAGLWAVAFVGVCVLVGLGKVKPEVIEALLMGMLGSMTLGRKST